MRITTFLATIVAGAVLFTPIASAQEATHPAVKARTSLMQLYASNVGQLGAMAQGKMDYNAEAAMMAANNLSLLVQLDQSAMWAQGTDSDALAGSRARIELWQNFPDVMEKGGALGAAVAAMKDAAGTDLASLQAAMGTLGAACSACHKAYREPKG